MKNKELSSIFIVLSLFIGICLLSLIINTFNLFGYVSSILGILVIIIPILLIIYFIFKSIKFLDTKQKIILFIVCSSVILFAYILAGRISLLISGYFVPIIMYSYIQTIKEKI